MVQADRETNRERKEDRQARDRRDTCVADTRQALIDARAEVDFMYGTKAVAACGFTPLPSDPAVSVETAIVQADNIEAWEPTTAPRIHEYRYTSDRLTSPLREQSKRLADSLKALAVDLRETEEALVRKEAVHR